MNPIDIYYGLSCISIFSTSVSLFICFINYKSFTSQLKALWLYLAISLLHQVISFFLLKSHKSNSIPFEIFTLLEGILIIYVYGKQFGIPTRFIFAGQVLICFLCGLPYFFSSISKDFPGVIISLSICILSLSYFYKIFTELKIPLLGRYYFFWINSGFLFYFGSTFLLRLFETYIRNSTETIALFLWGIQFIANSILNLMLSAGLWQIKKT